MSVKSLSVAEWCNTMVTEPLAHWWKPAAFAVLRPGCRKQLSWKNHKLCSVWLLTRLVLQLTWVWSGVLFFPVSVSGYYGRTNKEKMEDYRWWNLKLKLNWGPKTYLQLQLIAIGAAKDNEMKIFKIIILRDSSIFYYYYYFINIFCVFAES